MSDMTMDSFILRAMRAQAAEYGADMEERERQAQEAFLKSCEGFKEGETISIRRPIRG